MIDGRLYVADTGNRRVLGWQGVPAADQPADFVLGQSDFASSSENRGGAGQREIHALAACDRWRSTSTVDS